MWCHQRLIPFSQKNLQQKFQETSNSQPFSFKGSTFHLPHCVITVHYGFSLVLIVGEADLMWSVKRPSHLAIVLSSNQWVLSAYTCCWETTQDMSWWVLFVYHSSPHPTPLPNSVPAGSCWFDISCGIGFSQTVVLGDFKCYAGVLQDRPAWGFMATVTTMSLPIISGSTHWVVPF